MEQIVFYILLGVLFLCILWAGARILEKAGFEPTMVLFLLIPVINIIMIWYFAFTDWPNLQSENQQEP